MRRKMLLLVPVALLALSIVVPAIAKPNMFLVMQCEITGFEYKGLDPEGRGWLYDVPFEGVAGGPNVREGTVEGVDHFVYGWDGTGYLNVFWTMTNKDGEKFSVHVTGRSYTRNPGQIVFEDAWATVIDIDGYPTTGKYVGLIGTVFRDEGFITEFTPDPPGGYLHVKLYWN